MKDPGRSSMPRPRRTQLTLVTCVAALLALPTAAQAAGTVTSDGSRVTYTGSSGNDSVKTAYGLNDDEVGGPSVTISTDSALANGSPGQCVQQSYSPETVTCRRTAEVVLDLGAGDDEGTGDTGDEV